MPCSAKGAVRTLGPGRSTSTPTGRPTSLAAARTRSMRSRLASMRSVGQPEAADVGSGHQQHRAGRLADPTPVRWSPRSWCAARAWLDATRWAGGSRTGRRQGGRYACVQVAVQGDVGGPVGVQHQHVHAAGGHRCAHRRPDVGDPLGWDAHRPGPRPPGPARAGCRRGARSAAAPPPRPGGGTRRSRRRRCRPPRSPGRRPARRRPADRCVSCRNATSPTSSAVGRPRWPGPRPTAVDTTPSMPLAPRLACTSMSHRGATYHSRSRIGIEEDTTSGRPGGGLATTARAAPGSVAPASAVEQRRRPPSAADRPSSCHRWAPLATVDWRHRDGLGRPSGHQVCGVVGEHDGGRAVRVDPATGAGRHDLDRAAGRQPLPHDP